jgi:bidirectional [NiFe] hydrogenase diaphorase subunit
MKAEISVVIDGKEVRAEKGTPLLAAARRAGIDIPTLCHHEALEPYGACRLCLVEISRGVRTRMTTACTYPLLRDGETVSTCSARVLAARKVVMELLLARCPGAAAVRETAERIGVKEGRFPTRIPSRLDAKDESLSNCILCGLCVRACRDAIGVSAIGFADRGPNRRVAPPFYVNSAACTGCGACAAVCPTGAIGVEDSPRGIRRFAFFNTEVALARCRACGRFFAPLPQLKALREKVPNVGEHIGLCPGCRAKAFGAKIAGLEGGVGRQR